MFEQVLPGDGAEREPDAGGTGAPDLEVIEGSVLQYAVTPIASDPQGAGASDAFLVRVTAP